MLAGIQNAGGIRALKKVDRSQIRDRSEAMVGGRSADTGPHGSGLPPAGVAAGGGGGNVTGSLALMAELQKRKEKVSKSGRSFLFSCLYYGPPPADKQTTRSRTTTGTRLDKAGVRRRPTA